jgi:asparaginyl-tRNA synthetase
VFVSAFLSFEPVYLSTKYNTNYKISVKFAPKIRNMKLISRKEISIENLNNFVDTEVDLQGWIMNKRLGKNIAFLILRDGTGMVQCVVNQEDIGDELFQKIRGLGLETSAYIKGKVLKDEKQIGGYEIQVSKIVIYQEAMDYPISKKEHGVDFLMDHRHLWLRSRRPWATMRIRNRIIFAIHSFFQEKGFVQMDAPIFTGNAVEGTSTLFKTDFFDAPAYLSQSGQLYGEAMAMAMGKIYTFGPTFRAEKSKTRRHLSEFWMIEPEMAFYDNERNMDLIEEMIQYVIMDVLAHCVFELEVLERDTRVLKNVKNPFPRLSYDEAVDILTGKKDVNGRNAIALLYQDMEEIRENIKQKEEELKEREARLAAGNMKKGQLAFNEEKIRQLKVHLKEQKEKVKNIPHWIESATHFTYGNDFGGSDETILTRLYDEPLMVYNWPRDIKAFYMKTVEGNPELVKGIDVLAPEGYGEIVGGAERETDLHLLEESIKRHQLPQDVFEWYLDLRRFGSVPHAGFGLGLERFVAWVCKTEHIRETIPFPRMMGRLFP